MSGVNCYRAIETTVVIRTQISLASVSQSRVSISAFNLPETETCAPHQQ
jgi:hypothetical protein